MIKVSLGLLLICSISLAVFGVYMILDRLVKGKSDDRWVVYIHVLLISVGGVMAYFTLKCLETMQL
jgi:hypothetical protein